MNARRTALAALAAVMGILLSTLTAGVPASAADPPPPSTSFAQWTPQINGGADVSFAADGAAHQGAGALKVVNNSARKPDVYGFLRQSVPVKPSTTYEFTAWAKSDGLPELGVQITLSPDWNQRYTFPAGSYGWTKRTWTYTTKADQTTLDYRILSQDLTQGFWLDDLTVTEAGSTQNLLGNGDFERHWPPNLITSPSLVLTRGDAEIQLRTLPGITAPARWTVTDEQRRPVDSGSAGYADGAATIGLDHLGPGYYNLDVTLDAGTQPTTTSAAFAVLDPLPPAAQRPESPFGVAVHLGDGNAMNGKLAALAQQAGLAHARSDVSWHKVEQSPGEYTFPEGYDTDWKRFAAHGVRPLLLSTYRNPLYDGGKTPSSPEGLDAYAAYTSALLDQYGDLTKDVEVYNEFNINFNDGACGRTPACYYDMLRRTSQRVKADHPDATVAGPATAGLALDWVEQLLALGGADHLDAVSVHPYRHPNSPEGLQDELAALGRTIREHNDGKSLPIWLTELGWPTPENGGNTRAQQAEYLIRAQALALASGVERFYWYELMSSGRDPDNKEHHFGLLSWSPQGVTQALPPKEAFVTQSVMTRKLAGKAYAGRDEVAEPAYSYRFGQGADTVRVMWAAPDARAATLRADDPVKVTDAYGRSRTLTPVDGAVRLDLDGQPVFVQGQVEEVTVTEAPALSLSAPAKVAKGDRIPVKLTVDRTGGKGEGIPGTLTADIDGQRREIRAPQGEKTTLTVDVAAGERRHERHIVAELGPGARTMARLTARTQVTEPVTLTADPKVTAADPTAGEVRVTLTNNRLDAELPVDALEWTIGEKSGSRTDIGTVAPGSSTSVRVPFDQATPWQAYRQKVTAKLPGREPLTLDGTTGFNPVEREGSATVPPLDLGKQARWEEYTEPWGGEQDLSGPVRVSYTDDELVLKADVTDDVLDQDNPASTMYNGDSIQFAVSPGPPGRSSQMTEIGLAKLPGGPAAYTYMAFGQALTGPTSGARTTVTREGTTTSYEVRVPWTSVGFTGRPDGPISLSVMVNDNDGQGREGFLEWGSGIGRSKNTGLFRPVQLMP